MATLRDSSTVLKPISTAVACSAVHQKPDNENASHAQNGTSGCAAMCSIMKSSCPATYGAESPHVMPTYTNSARKGNSEEGQCLESAACSETVAAELLHILGQLGTGNHRIVLCRLLALDQRLRRKFRHWRSTKHTRAHAVRKNLIATGNQVRKHGRQTKFLQHGIERPRAVVRQTTTRSASTASSTERERAMNGEGESDRERESD